MIVVGITGSIGCGKTTLAKIISELGYNVFDADAQVRNIYKKNNFIELIKLNFPEVFEKNTLNKKKLRELVFHNVTKKEKLEKIVHPLLINKLKLTIRKNIKYCDFLFIDAIKIEKVRL